MKKAEILNALINVLLSLKTEATILVVAVIGASIIPYNRIWYFISSVAGIAVILLVILVIWESVKPNKSEHPGIAAKNKSEDKKQ